MEAGLRIDTDRADHSGKLGVEVANAPEPGDAIIEKGRARVFIAPDAATPLASMRLEAIVRERSVTFNLRAAS